MVGKVHSRRLGKNWIMNLVSGEKIRGSLRSPWIIFVLQTVDLGWLFGGFLFQLWSLPKDYSLIPWPIKSWSHCRYIKYISFSIFNFYRRIIFRKQTWILFSWFVRMDPVSQSSRSGHTSGNLQVWNIHDECICNFYLGDFLTREHATSWFWWRLRAWWAPTLWMLHAL